MVKEFSEILLMVEGLPGPALAETFAIFGFLTYINTGLIYITIFQELIKIW